MKIKKCKFCGDEFNQARPMQNVCSPDCAYKLVEQKKIKKAAKAIKDKEKELKKHFRS
jgi:ribosomal protein L24E